MLILHLRSLSGKIWAISNASYDDVFIILKKSLEFSRNICNYHFVEKKRRQPWDATKRTQSQLWSIDLHCLFVIEILTVTAIGSCPHTYDACVLHSAITFKINIYSTSNGSVELNKRWFRDRFVASISRVLCTVCARCIFFLSSWLFFKLVTYFTPMNVSRQSVNPQKK